MFLYGMRMMGDGLKQSSGGAMKVALAKVTNNAVIGFIFGMLVTCMIQSSTATIVLTVGLVGAGFLTFRQSVGIVLGANVGTAITAQIIRLMDLNAGNTSILYFFKADNLAPTALLIGMLCIMGSKKDKIQKAGNILVGFGILFMGLIFMSSAVSDMGDVLGGMLTKFEDNGFLGFLAGVIVTGIIQSSSAVVGILQSMASSVGVRFCGVFAVIIGVNIGDCLTTFLVSRIGAKPVQIRTALVHVIYNILAAALLIVGVNVLHATGLLDSIWEMPLNSGGVANVHGIFRMVPAILLLPFSGLLANVAEKLVPDSEEGDDLVATQDVLKDLDERLVTSPALALDRCRHFIFHMAGLAYSNYEAATQQIVSYDTKRANKIREKEQLLDRMADASNSYLLSLSEHITLKDHNLEQTAQMKAMPLLERIGDQANNIAIAATRVSEQDKALSDEAMADLAVCTEAIREILDITLGAYMNNDLGEAHRVEPLEEVIDALIGDMQTRHVNRMTRNICDVVNALQFENMLTAFERISDHCSDLALVILSQADTSIIGNEHDYIHRIHHAYDASYNNEFQKYHERYFGKLTAAGDGTVQE